MTPDGARPGHLADHQAEAVARARPGPAGDGAAERRRRLHLGEVRRAEQPSRGQGVEQRRRVRRRSGQAAVEDPAGIVIGEAGRGEAGHVGDGPRKAEAAEAEGPGKARFDEGGEVGPGGRLHRVAGAGVADIGVAPGRGGRGQGTGRAAAGLELGAAPGRIAAGDGGVVVGQGAVIGQAGAVGEQVAQRGAAPVAGRVEVEPALGAQLQGKQGDDGLGDGPEGPERVRRALGAGAARGVDPGEGGRRQRRSPWRPARSVKNCQATRPERPPRVACHSIASARSVSGSI